MTITQVYRRVALALIASAAVTACSDTSIESPGSTTAPPASPPASGPTVDADFVGSFDCTTFGAAVTQETVPFGTQTADVCQVSGVVTSNITVPAGATLALDGKVVIGQDGGLPATIFLQPGSRVVGASTGDYLVIARGSKIEAEGSPSDPVIFTSMDDAFATAGGAPRNGTETVRQEWGGLIINGYAPINACTAPGASGPGGSATCTKLGEGDSGPFGGNIDDDDSGTLRYVQVKYAGFEVTPDNELNGIAFQGVGSGTEVEYVQVHNNYDDGIEFFGGTVSAKHLVITGARDDSIDWTDGWTGNIQFALVQHGPDAGDNGIEGDNRENSPNLAPRSNPTISNFTFVGNGPVSDVGVLTRHGTAGTIINGIITGFDDKASIDVDADPSDVTATHDHIGTGAGDLRIDMIFADSADDIADAADDETFAGGATTLTEELVTDAGFAITGDDVSGDDNTLSDGYFPGLAELAFTPIDPTAFDTAAFTFDPVTYIGAFSGTETEASNWASGWTFGLFPEVPPTCPIGTAATGETKLVDATSKIVCSLGGTVRDDVHLVDGDRVIYKLTGKVVVGDDAGPDPLAPIGGAESAILTIDAGVTVYGEGVSDYLVISRGSQIRSNGTPGAPVVFTSQEDVDGTVDPLADRQQWGGLIINGRAPINACTATGSTGPGGSVTCFKSGEGDSGLFGGATDDDDSGNLFYTRVQYAGFEVTPDNELNGIAFQGVGTGTEVDYVQVHNNYDDGVEFFGGTVNASHLVITGARDDSLDWTDGWVGHVQYVIIHHGAGAGDNGFEGDNRENTPNASPRSTPFISNFTMVGNGAVSDVGVLARHGTAGHIINGIITGFDGVASVDVDADPSDVTATHTNVGAGLTDLRIDAIFADSADDIADAANAETFAAGALTLTEELVTDNGFVIVGDDTAGDDNTLSGTSLYPSGTGYTPGVAGPEAGVTAIDPSGFDAFFDSVTYIGAVEDATDTWYLGWTLQLD